MKILAIRIKNLASLEGVTEIDFTQEPLCSAGIFAITGPTGAGKSTILDALCLALYGKTPRYLQAKETNIEVQDVQGSTIAQGDVRGILRDGTGEGFAEVDFVGIDGQKYRANWSVRRAKNSTNGSLQAYGVSLLNLSTNAEIPGKKTEILAEIERLVGLNFEQFTRSVLLAQGDFTAFLKAAKDEKSSLLEKLTGTQIYSEISKRIFERCKAETQALNLLNVQREGIPILTTEELETFSTRKKELESLITTTEKELQKLGQEISWFAQWEVLQASLSQAEESLTQTTQNKASSASREEKLKQVEQVQQTRTWVESLQQVQEGLQSKTAALKQLETHLQYLQQQETESARLVTEALAALEQNIKNEAEAKPLLDRAKALDVQLKEKEAQVTKAAQELEARKKGHEENARRLEQKQQQVAQLQEDLKALHKWKEDNKGRQPIAENDKLILSKLTDAHKFLETLHTLEKELQTATQTLQHKTGEKDQLQQSLSEVEKSLQQEKEKLTTAETALAAISITTLEQEKAALDPFLEDVLLAASHWSVLFKTGKETEQLKSAVQNKKEELQQKTAESIQKEEALKVSAIQLFASRSMLDRARLAVTESVETLRAKLSPNEPCLVCGSLDHPYVTHDPKQEYVLSELESQYKILENEHNTLVREEARLKEAVRQLTETIQTGEAELLSKTGQLRELESKWNTFRIAKEAAQQPREQVENWLQQQAKEARETQKNLQSRIADYHSQKETLETQKNALRTLEKKAADLIDQLKDLDRTLLSLTERMQQQSLEQEKTDRQLSELKEALVPYFQSDKWFQNWKANPANMEQSISTFARQWKDNAERTQQLTQEQSVLATSIQSLTEQVKEQQEEAQKKAAVLTELQKDYATHKKERDQIFNGKPVSQIEEELKAAIETAKSQADTQKAKKEKIHTELTRTLTQKEQGEKELASGHQQKEELEQKIQTWIRKYNQEKAAGLTLATLTELLQFQHDWIDTERQALKALDEALTRARSVLTERQVALEKHTASRQSQQSLEELKTAEAQLKTGIQERTKENNEIQFRIRQDEENKQKLGTLLQAIEAKSRTAENWEKLNDIIGSADGKKFRQIAQEYTLDVLLSYANLHLEMLSKRYLLQRIPNTLGLQVLDQDMGDEVRTVFSLSGGESFLVSLALALGLASLSSNRMKVESLFIDEGFGSLDPNTLNLAMDALERLQNQGRKVGVISHVQEMTERIPVQIKVSKQSSGKSKVEVV